jgi:hypothetical protein
VCCSRGLRWMLENMKEPFLKKNSNIHIARQRRKGYVDNKKTMQTVFFSFW